MPENYAVMSDNDLLGRLARVSVTSAKAAMAFAALTDDEWFGAIAELRRRYRIRATEKALVAEESNVSPSGRLRRATTVEVDPQRWRRFWNQRRVTMVAVGTSIGRSSAWASVVANRRRVCLNTLDELATEWGVTLDELILAVGTDSERERAALHF